ncbi:DNA cytosine methyltransferase [Casimicrobium huifangae]|uniref:DNA cytosine methyltransferase n=1 Tax=Casimicrobium huifangae TaxID=2591109 RepID=UPI003783923A
MNELALFAGAGGGILGGKLLGWTPVCGVEIDPHGAATLAARQNDGEVEAFPIWDDICTFDGRPWRGVVDVVSGGFPCQDISEAGHGAGIDGSRSGLWREMARIVREVRPRYVLVENSRMLVQRGLTRVLGEFAAMGFDARWGVLGAVDVGANHKRKRTWIVAYANRDARQQWWSHYAAESARRWDIDRGSLEQDVADANRIREQQPIGGIGEVGRWSGDGGLQAALPDANSHEHKGKSHAWRRQGEDAGESQLSGHTDGARLSQRQSQPSYLGQELTSIERADWWLTEPAVGRVADGVADRVDQLRALGNGQVPRCMAEAWRRLTA